jgi:hypothetical protein
MIFGLQVQDIRGTKANGPLRTAAAILDMMDAWASKSTDKNGYVLSRRKNKKIPFEYVLHAGPVAGAESKYSVRINLPKALKQFAGSRYGCWKATGLPNGFEFTGFSSQKSACEFVKSIREIALAGDVDGFTQFLLKGDGSDRYYKSLNEYYRNAKTYYKAVA